MQLVGSKGQEHIRLANGYLKGTRGVDCFRAQLDYRGAFIQGSLTYELMNYNIIYVAMK